MEFKALLTVFCTVFVAELGDKTQLATMLFASDKDVHRLATFAAAALALVLSCALAVAVGALISECIGKKTLSVIAGSGFIAIGVCTLAGVLRS